MSDIVLIMSDIDISMCDIILCKTPKNAKSGAFFKVPDFFAAFSSSTLSILR